MFAYIEASRKLRPSSLKAVFTRAAFAVLPANLTSLIDPIVVNDIGDSVYKITLGENALALETTIAVTAGAVALLAQRKGLVINDWQVQTGGSGIDGVVRQFNINDVSHTLNQ